VQLDREQLLLAARRAVSEGLQAAGEDRKRVALTTVRDLVPPHQMEQFWVALIEHSIDTLRPFIAVYGDEFTPGTPSGDPAGHQVTELPLHLVNDALHHASAGDYDAVADTVRLITCLDEQQRALALVNIVHLALVIGDTVSSHPGTTNNSVT
jgi:hypothetical protein